MSYNILHRIQNVCLGYILFHNAQMFTNCGPTVHASEMETIFLDTKLQGQLHPFLVAIDVTSLVGAEVIVGAQISVGSSLPLTQKPACLAIPSTTQVHG